MVDGMESLLLDGCHLLEANWKEIKLNSVAKLALLAVIVP